MMQPTEPPAIDSRETHHEKPVSRHQHNLGHTISDKSVIDYFASTQHQRDANMKREDIVTRLIESGKATRLHPKGKIAEFCLGKEVLTMIETVIEEQKEALKDPSQKGKSIQTLVIEGEKSSGKRALIEALANELEASLVQTYLRRLNEEEILELLRYEQEENLIFLIEDVGSTSTRQKMLELACCLRDNGSHILIVLTVIKAGLITDKKYMSEDWKRELIEVAHRKIQLNQPDEESIERFLRMKFPKAITKNMDIGHIAWLINIKYMHSATWVQIEDFCKRLENTMKSKNLKTLSEELIMELPWEEQ